jgi:hypothetical protein
MVYADCIPSSDLGEDVELLLRQGVAEEDSLLGQGSEDRREAKHDRLGEDSAWYPWRVVNARLDEPPSAIAADDSEEAEVRADVETSRPIPDEHRLPGPWLVRPSDHAEQAREVALVCAAV